MTDAEHFFVLWSTLANALAWRAIDALIAADQYATLFGRRSRVQHHAAHRWARRAKAAHARAREAIRRCVA